MEASTSAMPARSERHSAPRPEPRLEDRRQSVTALQFGMDLPDLALAAEWERRLEAALDVQPQNADETERRERWVLAQRILEEAVLPEMEYYAAAIARGDTDGLAPPFIACRTLAGFTWYMLHRWRDGKIVSAGMIAAGWWRLSSVQRDTLHGHLQARWQFEQD